MGKRSINLKDVRVLKRKAPELYSRLMASLDLEDDRFRSDEFYIALKRARGGIFTTLEQFLDGPKPKKVESKEVCLDIIERGDIILGLEKMYKKTRNIIYLKVGYVSEDRKEATLDGIACKPIEVHENFSYSEANDPRKIEKPESKLSFIQKDVGSSIQIERSRSMAGFQDGRYTDLFVIKRDSKFARSLYENGVIFGHDLSIIRSSTSYDQWSQIKRKKEFDPFAITCLAQYFSLAVIKNVLMKKISDQNLNEGLKNLAVLQELFDAEELFRITEEIIDSAE